LAALCLLLGGLAAHASQSHLVPFKVTGGGTAPEGLSLFGAASPHNSTGTATQLGKYSDNEGVAEVLSFDLATLTGTFHGSFVFVAANGDRLACNYGGPGTFAVTLTESGEAIVEFVAVFTPDPARCTGRFAKVIGGGFTMIATTDPFDLTFIAEGFTPPFHYTWEGDGSLEFSNGQ
jgi:hypothetical protein